MSYSFTVRAADKEQAKVAVAAEFGKVLAQQPVHVRDQAAMLANANAVIDLLADNASQDVSVACNGSVSWNGVGEPAEVPLVGANVSASAWNVPRA